MANQANDNPAAKDALDVMIITHNERLNLPYCLDALKGWTRRVFVIDSGSSDGTQQLARAYGAEVVEHAWPGYAEQKNWGLENLPLESPWVLILDADERVSDELAPRIREIVSRPDAQTEEAGFFVNRLPYFLGSPIRHCGMFPNWNLRLFKRGQGRYEDRAVHEHLIVDGSVGYLDGLLHHHDRRGLEHYIAKHNRYSTLEAQSLFEETLGHSPPDQASYLPPQTLRRRWLKRNAMPYLPMPGLWRFVYMALVRFGFLDGRTGLKFCAFIATYDSMVALKLGELKIRYRQNLSTPLASDPMAMKSGLAAAEGTLDSAGTIQSGPVDSQSAGPSRSTPGQGTDWTGSASNRSPTDLATQPNTQHAALEATQTQPESSPWSFTEKVARALWMTLGKPLFRCSFHNWYRYRNFILRRFGAQIGKRVTIRPTVNVEIPWMLHIEQDASVGDYAILYSLGHVRVGRRTIVSQYAHLCAGTHDYTDHRFKLLRSPVVLGNDCWIGADAFVGPGVHVGDLTVVGARASAYKNLPPGKVCVGNPARPIKDRVLH